MDLGLLVARVVFGALLAAHGCQKLFGWFGGPGLGGTARFFESLGFHPGRVFAVAAGIAELAGGLLMGLGLAQPVAATCAISVMIVAIGTVHWGKGLLAPEGIEHPSLYLGAALALALTGPGALSLDASLGLTSWWTAPSVASVLAAGVVGALASLGLRRRAPRLAPA